MDMWLSRLAAAAAKSLQSCLTLCNPTDGSPLGSPVPGIQRRGADSAPRQARKHQRGGRNCEEVEVSVAETKSARERLQEPRRETRPQTGPSRRRDLWAGRYVRNFQAEKPNERRMKKGDTQQDRASAGVCASAGVGHCTGAAARQPEGSRDSEGNGWGLSPLDDRPGAWEQPGWVSAPEPRTRARAF